MEDNHMIGGQNLEDLEVQYGPKGFIDGENSNEQTLQNLIKGDIPIKFDWQNRWLKGDEYAHILKRIE
jgi:hypothetical protein